MGDEIVAELSTKLNKLYREAQLSQIEDDFFTVKSDIDAEKHLTEGDQHFYEGLFENARRSYTICLAHAEEDSELIGKAYANRSAALFRLGYFEQCLLDIDRALNSNYPEDKKKRLHGRKEEALKKAEQSPPLASSRTSEVEAEWRDKLCDFHNPHIPGASNKIKIESNETWGRHLIATEDINAGEILTSQKFFTMVKPNDENIEYHICSHCLLYHPALIACPTCTAVYCSEHCRTQAFNSYHRIECRIFRIEDFSENNILEDHDFIALRCLLVGTDQGAGLASLMKKIRLLDIVDGEANIDEFTDKPFSGDYVVLLRLLRKFVKLQSDEVHFIPWIIIALQKAGYFDNVPDRLQHEANVDPKADRYNNCKSERDDDCNETLGTSASKRRHRRKKTKAWLNSASARCDDTNVQKKFTSEAHLNAKYGNIDESVYEYGGISSKVLDSVEAVDESVDKKEDPEVSKNEDRLIVPEHEDPSRIANGLKLAILLAREILEANDKKEDPDSSENEDIPQEHEDSPKIAGEKFIKEVPLGYYCELCNLSLCYNQEMSRDEVLLAHCSTPLHLERSLFKITDEKDVTAQECVTGTLPFESLTQGTMAEEARLDSPLQPESSTEFTTAPPEDSLRASSDANEQNSVERQDATTQEGVAEVSLLKNVTLDMTAEEPPSDSTTSQPKSRTEPIVPPLDSLPACSDANEQNLVERQTDLTAMELYASFLLFNHRQSIDNATFALRKYRDVDVLDMLYGYGVCILHAMINHSCDPNVDFMTRGQEMVLCALRPIPKGEQIFISYPFKSFAFSRLEQRQKIMSYPSSKFQFNCECEACVKKWPVYDDLLKLPRKFLDSDKRAARKAIHKITSNLLKKKADSTSRLEIIQVIRRLCEWLYNNVERPFAASAICEQALIRAMKHFYDTSSPFELTELCKKEKSLEHLSKIIVISVNLYLVPT